MVLCFHLEIFYYLAICISATLFKGCLPSFIDILGYVSFCEMIKLCFLLSFEEIRKQKDFYISQRRKRNSSVPTNSSEALKSQPKKKKPLPIVRSVIVHEICQALDLDTELQTTVEFPDFQLPRKIKREIIPIVQSEDIFKFCIALNLKVALANSPYALK
ncbi:hypothetical protein TNCV_2442371 [Trichonephila clavipes]|nr:hypothetical protein TNCV_2442371 [Trichonephila clavipes]